jgi:hypothetical protein
MGRCVFNIKGVIFPSLFHSASLITQASKQTHRLSKFKTLGNQEHQAKFIFVADFPGGWSQTCRNI